MSRGESGKKRKGLYMKVVVAVVVLQVIAYTWVHLYLSSKCGVEIAPTTSLGFYGFCGFEAGICGYLKKKSDKDKSESEDT